jgi:Zn-dependent peptidase ImmA (M78 family)
MKRKVKSRASWNTLFQNERSSLKSDADSANSAESALVSASEITQLTSALLRRAGVYGVLPTPLDHLYKISNVDCFTFGAEEQRRWERMRDTARNVVRRMFQKLRGFGDLREKAVFVASDAPIARDRFVKGHELGHQVIPWHRIRQEYIDDNYTLSPAVRALFEREANFFAAEVLFQADLFSNRARDYTPSLDAVFTLAEEHQSSRQATLWRFAEIHDYAVVGAIYYPTISATGTRDLSRWTLWREIASPNFKRRFPTISLPRKLDARHPFVLATASRTIVHGDSLEFQNAPPGTRCSWSSWWNRHAILVLLSLRNRIGYRLIR